MKIAVMGLAVLLATSEAKPSVGDAYSDTVAGMQCKQWEPAYAKTPQMDCTYTVGKSLGFTLTGVNQDDAAWTVMRSDHNGDYYVSLPTSTNRMHDCAIVKAGVKYPYKSYPAFAFVSPRTGKVFRTWAECVKS
jgi:hypothetical protein